MDKSKNKGTIQSLERAVSILRCFDEHPLLRITDISKMLSLHKSTVYGLVNTMVKTKLLEQDKESGKYRLGLELLRLGTNVKSNLQSKVTPYLHKLAERFNETVNFVVRDDDCVMYVEKIESPHSMRICTKIGQRMPMYCTAVGKAILAYCDEQDVQQVLSRAEYVKFTENTLTDKDVIINQLKDIRRVGYALDREELEYGLICVAVPILDFRSKPIGGISVSGPATRMGEQQQTSIARTLISYAKEIYDSDWSDK
jgi:IclR family KDG regulon transcriptional repressor